MQKLGMNVGLLEKKSQLVKLEKESGFKAEKIPIILQEITWDASATSRLTIREKSTISNEMNMHMKDVSKWCLSNSDFNSILDCGCGDGVLTEFLLSSHNDFSYTGIDLSSKMLVCAKERFPGGKYIHCDFSNFDKNDGNYDSIVFNESLHYFNNIMDILIHAKSLLDPQEKSCRIRRIIISHPKGFSNIILQRSKNKLLVQNLLPTPQEFEVIANILNMKIVVLPQIKSKHYLAVLESNQCIQS
jgi:SAM-dependent methyltransferase